MEVRRCLRPLNLVDEAASLCPQPLRSSLTRATEATRRLGRLARMRYPVRRLHGHGRPDGLPLVCLLAMDDASARYWAHTLFASPPAEERVGEVPALRVPVTARTSGADLALWQAPWPLSAVARRAVQVPSWVPLWLATDRSFEDVVTGDRSGRSARKNDVRRVERLGLTVRVTHEARAFDAFRRDLYEPFPWGDGQTLLREALLIADHNAWHLGQLAMLRRMLEAERPISEHVR